MTQPTPAALRPAIAPRGRHKIYLGMAAGVGKTMRALHEIRDLRNDGVDAVVGLLETHGRKDTMAAAEGLPLFPLLDIPYKGVTLKELDIDGILLRRPEWVMVDELAHTNAPGSRNPKRFMDVEALLSNGINVLSTLNVQHLESLNDEVARLTGVRVRERVPDAVVLDADEVVIVDISPESLRERLSAGKIYARDKIDQALGSFFTPENLSVLRELALRRTADVVEEEPTHPEEIFGRGVRERIVVAVRAEARDSRLIRRGARIAQRLKGDLLVVHVKGRSYDDAELERLNELETLARDLGASWSVVEGGQIASSLVTFLRHQDATQVLLGESHRSRFQEIVSGSVVMEIMRRTHGIDVYVIADDG
jgi:two-component system, OmpR family, sensor histidine kinase KdpD